MTTIASCKPNRERRPFPGQPIQIPPIITKKRNNNCADTLPIGQFYTVTNLDQLSMPVETPFKINTQGADLSDANLTHTLRHVEGSGF